MRPPRSLLLLEIVPDEADRHFRTSAYPYLMGLARRLGWRASWLALGVRYDPSLLYALEPGQMARLRSELRRLKPDSVVLNERVRPALPGAVYCPLDEDLRGLGSFLAESLGARAAGLDDPLLADSVEPVFSRRVLGGAPWAAAAPFRVVAGPRCRHRCSFCGAAQAGRAVFARDALEFAARAAGAACRAARGAPARFVFVGHELWAGLERFAAALERRGVRGAELGFMPRIDELLAARRTLERLLPRLARRGLSLRLFGMGVENFSAAENRRLAKGISAAQAHAAAALVARLSSAWPRNFRYPSGHLSTILFTPWTTPADLRTNVRHMARCPLIRRGAALGSRLQLFPGRPVSARAQRDGLLVRAGDERAYNSGCITAADQSELPWRFAHPGAALLWRLARRLSTNRSGLPEDAEARAVAALLPPQGESPDPPDPLPLFARAVELVLRRPRLRSFDELLALLGRRSRLL